VNKKVIAQKMLVKLTPGVDFINILRTNFSYERRFSSYVLALSKNSYEKFVPKTLMKLTAGSISSASVQAAFTHA